MLPCTWTQDAAAARLWASAMAVARSSSSSRCLLFLRLPLPKSGTAAAGACSTAKVEVVAAHTCGASQQMPIGDITGHHLLSMCEQPPATDEQHAGHLQLTRCVPTPSVSLVQVPASPAMKTRYSRAWGQTTETHRPLTLHPSCGLPTRTPLATQTTACPVLEQTCSCYCYIDSRLPQYRETQACQLPACGRRATISREASSAVSCRGPPSPPYPWREDVW